jgi:hypothetical protein
MYGNYVQGSTDSVGNAYNLLVSGAPSGYTSSGLMIGGDTATVYGVKILKDASNNAILDMRADISNKMSLRYKDNTSGAVSSMLDLTNDSALTGSGYGAQVNGRINASSYYVGRADTRAPINSGVYLAMDGSNVGKFSINKGSGSGGFSFKTYNSNGSLLQNNLNLLASGVVQAAYYTATGNAGDSEAVAIAGLDGNGNLVRNYAINARYRAAEARLTVIEGELTGDVPSKVNEIVNRLNGLTFFSQNISTIAVFVPSSPGPVNGPAGTAPLAPTNIVATRSSSSTASIAFTPSSGATSYTVTSSPGGLTATGSTSPILLGGLTNGSSYNFTIVSSNNYGNSSASSASNTFIPTSSTAQNLLGEFIQIKFPQPFVATSVKIAPGYNLSSTSTLGQDRTARMSTVAGSFDGVTWYRIYFTPSDTVWNNDTPITFNFTNTNAFTYYRWIATALQLNQPYKIWNVSSIKYYNNSTQYPPVQLTSNTLSGQSYGNGTYELTCSTGPIPDLNGVPGSAIKALGSSNTASSSDTASNGYIDVPMISTMYNNLGEPTGTAGTNGITPTYFI